MVENEIVFLDPQEDNQRRALDIYLESATEDNGFKPKSYQKISDQLYSEDFENCSKSQVERWVKIFKFKERLDKQIQLAYLNKDKPGVLANEVKSKSTQDIADRFKVNGELTDDLYYVARCFIDDVKIDLAKGYKIDKDRMKIIKDLLVLTTNREDKLLDRLAATGGGKLTSAELLKEFEEIELQIEEPIDVEIDDE